MLLTAAQPVSIVIACSPTVPIDANVTLQQLTHRFGGRGGGKPGLAQGGGLAAPPQEVASAAWTLIESMLASARGGGMFAVRAAVAKRRFDH